MMNSFRKQIILSAIILGLLLLVLLLSIGFQGRIIDSLRIVVGSISLLFIPGYWITRALFTNTELDGLEIVALSFAFSISVVPLLVFYTNLMGVSISQRLVFVILIIVSIAGISRVVYGNHSKQ